MGLVNQAKQALIKAIEREGNQVRLSKKTGVSSTAINRFYSGARDISNMTVKTLERLFPDITVYFFRNEHPKAEVPLPENLDPVERKVVRLLREMSEDGQLELLADAAVLKEKNPKEGKSPLQEPQAKPKRVA